MDNSILRIALKLKILFIGLALMSVTSSVWACSDSDIRFSSSSNRIYIENGAICTLSEINNIVVNKYSSVSPGELLEQTAPGIWLLKAEMRIEDGSTLKLHGTEIGGDVDTFLLLSQNGSSPTHIKIQARYGIIDINTVTITSWDPISSGSDIDSSNGRAFIHVNSYETETGGKAESTMNIINSDISYLGFYDAESYGLVWKVRGATSTDHSVLNRVHVYGDIKNSKIHHNYMGMYSYGAYEMIIDNNEVYNNESYGIDPHDDSDYLVITNNDVHDNGNHGIICSRRCNNLIITDNSSYRNRHGIMLHRDTNYTIVRNNTVYDNIDNGIALFESHWNTVENNNVYGNKHGIRLSLGSHDNVIQGNTIESNRDNGLYQYSGSDIPDTTDGRPANNQFLNNIVKNNGRLIKFRDSDNIIVSNNTFDDITDVEIYDSTNIQIVRNTHLFSQLEVKVDSSSTFMSDASVEVNEPVDVKLTEYANLNLINNEGQVFNAEEKGEVLKIRSTTLDGASVTSSSMTLTAAIIGSSSEVTPLPFWVTLLDGEIEMSSVVSNNSGYQWKVIAVDYSTDVEYRFGNLIDGEDYLLLKDYVPVQTLTVNAGQISFTELSSSQTVNYELIKKNEGQFISVNEDSYVRDGYPDTNYGTSSTLEVKLSGSDYNREGLLKFDISNYSSVPVTSATLTISGALSRDGSVTTDIYATDSNWSEYSVTWNNRPAPSQYLGSITIDDTSFIDYQIDITDYLNSLIDNNATDMSFILINQNKSTAVTRVRAREYSSGSETAQIEVQY